MTRDESLAIVGMIANHWPGSQWTEGSLDAYARAIESLDPHLTTKAVARAVNDLEFYPKVAVLRELVRIEKFLAQPDPPTERMPNDEAPLVMPAWVKGWIVSRRRYQDMRAWPQQKEFSDEEPMPVEDQARYMREGADVPVEDLFKAMIGDIVSPAYD